MRFITLLLVLTIAHELNAQEFLGSNCQHLEVSSPRGVQCLHCTETRARPSALGLLQATLDSCQKNIAFAFVLDSSFGSNFAIISEIADSLVQNGRQPFFHFYLLNGPAQRRYMDKVFPDSAFQINPFEFRNKINSDRQFRDLFTRHVQTFSDLFSNLSERGVVISIAPMLEDNLDDLTFDTVFKLTVAALPTNLQATYVRSTCRDCFTGNGSEIPEGLAREEHRGDINFDFTNGVISNDGWGYIKFPGDKLKEIDSPVSHKDKRVEKVMSLGQLKQSLFQAARKHNMFLLWLSKYQDTLPGNQSLSTTKRKYLAPSKREIRLIARFLRS